ncbi:MAG: Atrophin-1 multi-domain protein [Duganella sp.]
MRTYFTRLSHVFAVVGFAAAIVLSPARAQTPNYAATTGFGTYYQPFSADSPWNTRPVHPQLGTYQLRKPIYNPGWIPTIGGGSLSLGVFMAKASDPPVTIYGPAGTSGVGDPDTGTNRTITLPHWPANVVPASGSDGHADIVDVSTGILHSFFQLRNTGGRWTAAMYSWTRIDGIGWGDAVHWSQGARAAGVPPSGGLIRKHEVNDGASHYKHALAMSLPSQTLANGISSPSYIYPATTADTHAASHTGGIPLGARLALPPSFDITAVRSAALRKIANTLKIYGAFVVDTNYDTAFSIYVENGAGFNLMPNGWDTAVVDDLELIRSALRQVVGAAQWVDGNGKTKRPPELPGLVSMRGSWATTGSTSIGPGKFQTWDQAIVFPDTKNRISQTNYTNLSKVSWGKPAVGASMRFKSEATGGARIRLQVRIGNTVAFDSGFLQNETSVTFRWPNVAPENATVVLIAESGVNTPSSVRGLLLDN